MGRLFSEDSLDDFKLRRAEVDEQAVFDAGRAQVVDQLRDMGGILSVAALRSCASVAAICSSSMPEYLSS